MENPIKGGSQREEKGRTAEKGLGGTSALSCGEERNLIKPSSWSAADQFRELILHEFDGIGLLVVVL